jgi:hypothetical protein
LGLGPWALGLGPWALGLPVLSIGTVPGAIDGSAKHCSG